MKLEKQLAELEYLHGKAVEAGNEDLAKEYERLGKEVEKAIDEKAEYDLNNLESDPDSLFNL
jgi:hypothetical protein